MTVLSPPELAGLSPANMAKITGGYNIPGAPEGGKVIKGEIAGSPTYQLEVKWPEAEKLRAELGLGKKKLHVSLNGGIGDAVRARDAGKTTPTPDSQ